MSGPGPQAHVLATAEAAAQSAAAEIARRARACVAARGSFAMAVSGGRTPGRMLAALAGQDMPWESTSVFQVDERIGPFDDPQRNLPGLRRALPADGRARIVAMPVEADDLVAACAAYADVLPDRLDLVHLGLGADGHTASLVPGDAVLAVTLSDVAITSVYQGRRRMTLTYPPIDRARAVLWLVTGVDKQEALARLRAGDRQVPAGRVATAEQVLFSDSDASGRRGGPR